MKEPKLKRWLRAASLLVILCMLTACVGTSPGGIQGATQSLVIYVAPGTLQMDFQPMTRAIRLFKETYPNVKLEVNDFGGTSTSTSNYEFGEILKTELAAGKGPDMVFLDTATSSGIDLYKAMEAGVFADLNPYLQNDSSFKMSDYNEQVMNSFGIYKGKRYLIPLSYSVSTYMSTEQGLASNGLTFSEKPTFAQFSEQVQAYSAAYAKDATRFYSDDDWGFYGFEVYSGLKFVDYEAGTVLIDTPEFKQVVELYKGLYPMVSREQRNPFSGSFMISSIANALSDGNLAFCWTNMMTGRKIQVWTALKSHEQKMVSFAMPNVYGGKSVATPWYGAGIRNTSDNQVNAYHFIKILLSQGLQSSPQMLWYDLPVHNQARTDLIKYWTTKQNMHETTPDGSYTYKPLSTQETDHLIEMLSDAACVPNQSMVISDMVAKGMEPYFQGISTYEECVAKLQNELELYLLE